MNEMEIIARRKTSFGVGFLILLTLGAAVLIFGAATSVSLGVTLAKAQNQQDIGGAFASFFSVILLIFTLTVAAAGAVLTAVGVVFTVRYFRTPSVAVKYENGEVIFPAFRLTVKELRGVELEAKGSKLTVFYGDKKYVLRYLEDGYAAKSRLEELCASAEEE